jgi:hypothetical protein
MLRHRLARFLGSDLAFCTAPSYGGGDGPGCYDAGEEVCGGGGAGGCEPGGGTGEGGAEGCWAHGGRRDEAVEHGLEHPDHDVVFCCKSCVVELQDC